MTVMKKWAVALLLAVILPSLSWAQDLREVAGKVAAQNGGQSAVRGVDGWLFLREELEHLAAGPFWGEDAATATRAKNKKDADPLGAIIAYNKGLADKGITLYLMPVPPKALVYGDKLQAGLSPQILDTELELYKEFYASLGESGVQVIDLLPQLMAARDREDVYCRTDTHFSPAGLQLFAEAAAKRIAGESWYADTGKKQFVRTAQEVSIHGDLAKMAGENDLQEKLVLQIVTDENDKQLESDEKSPVILLGDSHTLVFQAGGDLHATGAGLFDQLSADLGFAVDLLGVRGSGVTPARIKFYQRAKKDPGYLDGKKALIWCFAARDFTGTGGWKEIPAAP